MAHRREKCKNYTASPGWSGMDINPFSSHWLLRWAQMAGQTDHQSSISVLSLWWSGTVSYLVFLKATCIWVTESADWDLTQYVVFLVHALSLIKFWPIKILPAHFLLKATQWATSLAFVLSTEVIGSKGLYIISHVLEMILGRNPTALAACQVTCRWPLTKKSTWKLMGHWFQVRLGIPEYL